MTLPTLDDDQADAIRAVAALYLSETRWATVPPHPESTFPPAFRAEILRRREACSLIVGGDTV